MSTIPTIRTWKDAPDPESILTYKEWGESLFDVIDFLTNPPLVHVISTTGQNVANATFVVISYQKVVADTHGFFRTAQPTRLTPTVPGVYKGWTGMSFAANAAAGTGRRILSVTKNGVSLMRRDLRGGLANQEQIEKGVRFYTTANGTTDYFEMTVYQESGATLTTGVSSVSYQPELFMRFWKPL